MAVTKSGTLTPNQVTTITVEISPTGANNGVGVLNRSQQGTIWVRMDGGNPAIAGDDSYPVLSYRLFDGQAGYNQATLKLVSDEAVEFTVEGMG